MFTPNGDGANDEFGPIFNDSLVFSYLFIVSSNNETLFETDDPTEKWYGDNSFTGEAENVGLYDFNITVNYDQNDITISGKVALVRHDYNNSTGEQKDLDLELNCSECVLESEILNQSSEPLLDDICTN